MLIYDESIMYVLKLLLVVVVVVVDVVADTVCTVSIGSYPFLNSSRNINRNIDRNINS